nr:EAL domain-containing protein [Thiocapsa bogorovii]
MEKRYYKKSGDVVWINLTVSLVRDKIGHPGYFISIIEDINERKQSELALRNSEEKFRALFEQAGSCCMILDPNTPNGIPLIVDANTSACLMHGYEREDFIGRPVSDIDDQAGKQLVKKRTAEIMTGKPFSVENIHVRKDGTTFAVSVNAKRIDIGGEPPLIFTTEYDISKREELHNRIQKIAAHVPGMIYQYQQWPDGHAAFPYTSAGIKDIYGVEPADASTDATAVFDAVHPDDRSRVEAKIAESMHDLTTWQDSYRIECPDGRLTWVEGEASPERQPDGSVLWHGSIRDVTDRKQAEEKLRLAASVFEHSFEAILITDAENRIIDTNPAFSAITGYEQASVLGQDPKILASGRHDQAFFREMWDAITRKGSWQGEIWNRRKDGELYAELLSISVVRHADQSIANYIAIFSDISELKAHEEELDRIANYDQLTGLPNRRLLFDRIEQASVRVRRSGRLMAVCYLDVDDFKPINDKYGHAVGDQVLIGIANRLRKVLRAQDTVARLGGDEFVLLFNDLMRLEDSDVLLERVLAACTSPIVLQGVTHRVSASIGVTLSPPDVPFEGDSADILLRHADQAMYRAKEAGRNRYHLYDAKQDRQLQERRLKLQRIKEALAEQEFVLFYQPKVDMAAREVIGVEALIRWRHPEDGLLLPRAFLPLIDGSDLEIAVGEWVISAALTQAAIWQHRGLKLPISVNISAGHLLAPSFAQRLGELLAEHPECDPGCLEMEILETSALSDVERAGRTLTTCRALGVRFALDDFGTGYSSLAYFRRLPIDVLKVDQSFVRDMLDDPDDMEIVESVVRLARAFKRVVIAEGVETPEHGALLILLGCPLGQGFGIARPMPADAIPGWVSTWPEQGEGMVVDQDIGKDDIPLMMAMQNHRRWVDEFVDALNDADLSRLSAIERDACRFERWYEGTGAAHYGALEAFHAVGPCHAAVHDLAISIMATAEHGEIDSARSRVPNLFKARDELIGHLEALIGTLRTAVE